MLRYRLFLIDLLLIMCMVLVACSFHEEKIENTPDMTDDTIYSDEQLLDIVDFMGSMDKMIESYNTNYIRKTDDIYCVIYRGEKKVLTIMFDISGNKIFEKFYDITMAKNDFDAISVGSKLSDVQLIDPDGEYSFLFTGRNDIPKISMHYTTDGFYISITYDVNNVVVNIEIEPI